VKQLQLRLADIFSILNAVFGFLGVCYLIEGNLIFATKLILLSALMDGIDGFIARKKGNSDFGKELDSLADLISFGILPSAILFKLGYIYASIPYLLSSLIRLARFNVLGFEDFLGLPTTASALMMVCFVNLNLPYVEFVGLVLALLMVSNLRYAKVRKKYILAVVGIIVLLGIFVNIALYILLALLIVYIISPAFKVKL